MRTPLDRAWLGEVKRAARACDTGELSLAVPAAAIMVTYSCRTSPLSGGNGLSDEDAAGRADVLTRRPSGRDMIGNTIEARPWTYWLAGRPPSFNESAAAPLAARKVFGATSELVSERSATFAEVTELVASFGVVTELAASFAEVTALLTSFVEVTA